jgi:hypothetical protein
MFYVNFPNGCLMFDQKKTSRIMYTGIHGYFEIVRGDSDWKDLLIEKFKQLDIQKWLSDTLIGVITTRKVWKNIQKIAQKLSFDVQLNNVNSTIMCVRDSLSSIYDPCVWVSNKELPKRQYTKFQNLLNKSHLHRDIMMIIMEMAFPCDVLTRLCVCGLEQNGNHYHCIRQQFIHATLVSWGDSDTESDIESVS